MSLKKFVVAGVLAAAVSTTLFAGDALSAGTKPAPAAAAPPATPAPAPVTQGLTQDQSTANHTPEQNWLKICDPIPAGQKGAGQKACIMREVVVANNQFLGSFLLRDDPGQESRLLAVAAVPLGVLLPFGLTWQIDGQKPIRVPYMICDPQSCASQLVINEQYVAALKKGAKLELVAKIRQNQDLVKDLVIPIDLTGFGPVYDGQASISFDELRKDTTGGQALEQQLQDRAEQLRQQLSGSAPAPSGAATPATPASN